MIVPLFAVFLAAVVPFALLGWLIHTWPDEIAGRYLYRVRDAAWDAGRYDDASRYDTVLATYGYTKSDPAQRYWSPGWILTARAEPVGDIDDVHRHIAAALMRSSLTAVLLTAAVFTATAVKAPLHPSTWRSAAVETVRRRVAGHEAYLDRNQATLNEIDEIVAVLR